MRRGSRALKRKGDEAMKRLSAVLLALLLVLAMAVGAAADIPDKPDAFAYAYDFTGRVLDSEDIAAISRYGAALESATGAQAIAVVVDFLDGADPADYATDLINSWGIGRKGEDDGIVILLARGDRKIQIGTGKGMDRVLTGSRCGKLIDANIDDFANNRFDRGMTALYEDVCEYVADAKGKKLDMDGASSSGVIYGNDSRNVRKRSGGLFDGFLGFIFMYIIVSVIFNALTPKGGGCLKWLLLGWLFNNRNNRNNRRPPMGGGFGGYGGGFGPRIPRTPPRSFGGSGGVGGGSSRGFGGSGRGFGGGGFGGGSSRGGGGGRSF